MSNVPTNLIPTTVTGLPEYTGSSTLGYLPYVVDGRTYKVQFSNIAAVGAVPSSRTIATGTGLTGGGDLSANRTIAIANGGVGTAQLAASGVSAGVYGSGTLVPVLTVDATGRVTAATTAAVSVSGFVPTSRSVIAGTGLTGGGALSSDVTLNVNFSSSTPQALGTATAGVSTAAARGDHVHPAVNLADTSQTQGALPLGRGGTGDALSPVAGAVVYSTGTRFALSPLGLPGQVLMSDGANAPQWATVSGIGTVTSVNVSGGTTGLTFSGGPVTAAGTITMAGTLAVGNGGTGTATQFTAGSLVFAGASGVYSQNNANLFWDNTNARLGVGTTTPTTRLHVQGSGDAAQFTNGSRSAFVALDSSGFSMFTGAGQTGNGLYANAASNFTAFYTSSAERMRVDSAGNVAIGIASTGSKLAISDGTNGFEFAPGTTNVLQTVVRPGGAYLDFNLKVRDFILTANNAEAMRVTNVGNVGVGTATPGAKLDVAAAGTVFARVYNTTTSADAYLSTQNTTGTGAFGVNATGQYMYTAQTIPMLFYTTGLERMRITAAGDVGIGTSAPSAKLDVVTTGAFAAEFNGTNTYVDIIDSTVTGRLQTVGNVFFIGTNTAARALGFKSGAGVEAMRIDSAGNVGIGVAPTASSNYAVLDIKGRATGQSALLNFFDGAGTQTGSIQSDTNYGLLAGASGARPFAVFTNGSERMIVTGAGNVGIGTSAPTVYTGYTSVEIDGATNGGILGIKKAGSVVGYMNGASGLLLLAQSNDLKLTTTGATSMQFSTNATERARITSAGRLGIGTTSPGALFVVSDGGAGGIEFNPNASSVAQIEAYNRTTSAYYALRVNADDARFFTGASPAERMRVKANGQVRFIPLAAAPAGPEAGDVYYDSTTNKLRCYNGTTWNDLF